MLHQRKGSHIKASGSVDAVPGSPSSSDGENELVFRTDSPAPGSPKASLNRLKEDLRNNSSTSLGAVAANAAANANGSGLAGSRNGSSTNLSNEEITEQARQNESKLYKMLTRSFFAFLMIIAFLLIVFVFGHVCVCSLVMVLQFLVYRELISLRYQTVVKLENNKLKWFRTIQWAWFFVAMVYAYGSSWLKAPMGAFNFLNNMKTVLPAYGIVDELSGLQALSFALYSILFTITVLSFQKGLYQIQLVQLTWTCLTLIICVAQLKFAVFMIHEGLFWFLFPVSLVIANDTFAYFTGMAFGKKVFKSPLIQISPNKTWEGFIGALILTVVYAIYGSAAWGSIDFIRCGFDETHALEKKKHCFSDVLFTANPETGWKPVQYHAISYALFASIIAPFGGFFASAIKRAFKVCFFYFYLFHFFVT